MRSVGASAARRGAGAKLLEQRFGLANPVRVSATERAGKGGALVDNALGPVTCFVGLALRHEEFGEAKLSFRQGSLRVVLPARMRDP